MGKYLLIMYSVRQANQVKPYAEVSSKSSRMNRIKINLFS